MFCYLQTTTALLLALVYMANGQGSGLSTEEQEEIVNAHNYYRRSVDPIATNMLKMVSHYGCMTFNYDALLCTGMG